ncbi:hypothetical protein D1007_16083 [Hordeum vulgare]|nr:hypothetical protein D1007_16083 [Hordeum vulgare]
MEDSMATHDERQWPGLDRAMALSATGDVAIPELMEEEEVVAFPPALVGVSWGWSCTAPEMAQTGGEGGVNWCPTPPRSPERKASPREEVMQASLQHAPAHQRPPPTSGRRRPTSTSSATATTTTPATSEDGDGNDGRATFFYVNYVKNWAVLWP